VRGASELGLAVGHERKDCNYRLRQRTGPVLEHRAGLLYGRCVLNPTPIDRRLDAEGRPYFLWDADITETKFRELLAQGDDGLKAVLIAKLMRQAKPDDVFIYATEAEIRQLWPHIVPHLGRTRAFWEWLLAAWDALDSNHAQG
jgi:hypothetical protein